MRKTPQSWYYFLRALGLCLQCLTTICTWMRRDPRDVLMWNYSSICLLAAHIKTISTLGLRDFISSFSTVFILCCRRCCRSIQGDEKHSSDGPGNSISLASIAVTMCIRARIKHQTLSYSITLEHFCLLWIPLAAADSAAADTILIIFFHFVSMAWFGQKNSSHRGSPPIDWVMSQQQDTAQLSRVYQLIDMKNCVLLSNEFMMWCTAVMAFVWI